MDNQRILIIDDDRKLCRLLGDYLSSFGYEIETAFTGPDGVQKALRGDFDAIILDVMLPGMDGFEVLKVIRSERNVPVLMLTTRGEETDRIVGLEMGADDYLPKTFSTREMLARLRAVIRRSASPISATAGMDENAVYHPPIIVRDLRIDLNTHTAFRNEDELDLTPLEYDLLVALARSAGRVLSRDMLLDRVSGRDYEVFDRSVDVHISSLRRKLGDSPRAPRYIKTVRTVGYMLLASAPEM